MASGSAKRWRTRRWTSCACAGDHLFMPRRLSTGSGALWLGLAVSDVHTGETMWYRGSDAAVRYSARRYPSFTSSNVLSRSSLAAAKSEQMRAKYGRKRKREVMAACDVVGAPSVIEPKSNEPSPEQ